ncbi:MAG: adenylate/guanylate cyclase domain-containing protein [Candidatus Latescibacterota bacterium]
MMEEAISHYHLLEELHRDDAVALYLAEDRSQARQVLLGVVRPAPGLPLPHPDRLARAAAALAALRHPCLPGVLSAVAHEGRLLVAMERVTGEVLRERIRRSALTPWASVGLVEQLCGALAGAGEAGLVHGVLRAEDVLVGDGERVRILPFGFAWQPQPAARRYLAPEQASGSPADGRSQVWAVAALLQDMILGDARLPSREERPRAAPAGDLPAPLRPVLERALRQDPGARYQTLAELGAALHEARGHLEQASAQPGSASMQQLLRQREDIDRRIAEGYTRSITIMMCDVVASTAYFERRGDLEGRIMVQRFVGLTAPLIERYHGKIVKTLGDGLLASFTEARGAADSAIAIQEALAAHNEHQLEEDRIAVRIALHFGKAVVDATDVFGDVVNVTSRMQHMAQGGSIVVSASLREQLAQHPDLVIRFAGNAQLKGKSLPAPYYRLVWRNGEAEEAEPGGLPSPTAAAPLPAAGVRIVRAYRMPAAQERTPPPAEAGRNPYMNRVKITRAEDFYGRRTEISRIVARIGASRPQSVSLVGERRIGKSSLLSHIHNPQTRRTLLENPHEFVFTFVDLQERRGIDIPDFFSAIYQSLRREMGDAIVLGVDPNYEGFKRVIQAFEQESLKLILIFDEFESITKNERFTAEFYSYARSIANNYNVAYLVSSGRDLQTLCHSKEISDSPFFNIFSNVTLTQFAPEETRELIVQPAARLGISLEPYVSFVTDIAGHYPFFVQMACAALFDLLQRQRGDSPHLREEVKEAFFDEARVHFQQIWDICDEDTREVLLRLAAGQRIHPSRDYVVKRLTREGYVKMEAGAPQVFSSIFGQHLLGLYGRAYRVRKRRRLWFITW